MCVSGLIFIKSKCRSIASSTRSLLPRATAINSPLVYDEAGRCRSRARDGNKMEKKGERVRAGMNNGFDDAKEQNDAGALGIYRRVTLTDAEQPGKCPRIEQTRPFSLPSAWRGLLTSLILGNYCHHRQPSDRNRAVTFSCYTCTIIIVSRNQHDCRIVYGYACILHKYIHRLNFSIGCSAILKDRSCISGKKFLCNLQNKKNRQKKIVYFEIDQSIERKREDVQILRVILDIINID